MYIFPSYILPLALVRRLDNKERKENLSVSQICAINNDQVPIRALHYFCLLLPLFSSFALPRDFESSLSLALLSFFPPPTISLIFDHLFQHGRHSCGDETSILFHVFRHHRHGDGISKVRCGGRGDAPLHHVSVSGAARSLRRISGVVHRRRVERGIVYPRRHDRTDAFSLLSSRFINRIVRSTMLLTSTRCLRH